MTLGIRTGCLRYSDELVPYSRECKNNTNFMWFANCSQADWPFVMKRRLQHCIFCCRAPWWLMNTDSNIKCGRISLLWPVNNLVHFHTIPQGQRWLFHHSFFPQTFTDVCNALMMNKCETTLLVFQKDLRDELAQAAAALGSPVGKKIPNFQLAEQIGARNAAKTQNL